MAKVRKSTKMSLGGSNELLTWALQGLEQEITTVRQRLQELESQARTLRSSARGRGTAAAGTSEAPAAAEPKVRKKRKLSADARRRIAEAQKRRWAKARAGKE